MDQYYINNKEYFLNLLSLEVYHLLFFITVIVIILLLWLFVSKFLAQNKAISWTGIECCKTYNFMLTYTRNSCFIDNLYNSVLWVADT